MSSRIRIPGWLLLLVFCAFFFLWQLSSFGLVGADEPRYAQIAREMLLRRDWVTPTLGGTAWLEKPPLYYWQAMIAYRVFGVSDWAARLPSVFDATLLVFAVYCFVRQFCPGFELDAGLMLATSAGMVGFARAAGTDMPLATTFTIAILAWLAWFENRRRGFLVLFYGFLALAMLAKGPVAPFLAAIIIAVFAAIRGRLLVIWTTLWLPGIATFCAIGLPWYVLVQLRNPQFFRVFILEHNLARFSSNMFHHPEPFWYYLPITLLSWMPWTVFVIAALICAIKRFRELAVDPVNVFLVVWIAVMIVFFSVSQSKLPGYILPAVPAGAVLLANYLREQTGQRPGIILASVHGILAGSLVFAAWSAQQTLFQHRIVWDSTEILALTVCVAIALALTVFLRKAGHAGLRLSGIVPAIVALGLALRLASPAIDDRLSARSVSEALQRVSRGQLPVALFRVSRETEFGLQFYRNQTILRYEFGQVPAEEHLVVTKEGFQKALSNDVPVRKVVYLGHFPAQKLEFFYVPPR